MADIALVLEPRTERGSAASRRLRVAGRIPAVVYGHGDEPLSVTVDARELRGALNASARGSALFDLVLGKESHLAIVREVQRHPVRQTVAHIDFQVVGRDEVVPAEVQIILIGEALQVTRRGGVIDHTLMSLHVHAKPGDIPASIEVDITDMDFGQSIRVSDLQIAAGIAVDADPETVVAIAQAPRAAEAEGEAAGEAVEGEAAAGEAGGAGATEAAQS
jgi:large subunit ribosomal protein L25